MSAPMFVQQGDTRSGRIDRRLAAMLAAIAGAVNTAAFQAVGFFAANMTGNVSLASNQAATGGFTLALVYLLIVIAFVIGAVVSTLLISLGRRRQIRGIYALSILVEAGLMAALGLIDPLLGPGSAGKVLVLGLSLLMGLQNAVVTRISNARVRTTHVSGMVTDIGIELAMLLDIARGLEQRSGAGDVLIRLRLHATTVMSFMLGGLVGVVGYRAVGCWLLEGCAFCLLLIALPETRKATALTKAAELGGVVPPR